VEGAIILVNRGRTTYTIDCETIAELRCHDLGKHFVKPSDCHEIPLCTILYYVGGTELQNDQNKTEPRFRLVKF
jgi:hypothetical protein